MKKKEEISMSMKVLGIVIALVFVVLFTSYLYQTIPMAGEVKTVQMVDNEGQLMGLVRLSETKAGTLLDLDIAGLIPNGEHAMHIHETGDCSPLETFKNAGGHYNPASMAHGMKHHEGHHAGDMPNLKPDDKGAIQTAFVNLKVTLGDSDEKAGRYTLFDADGSSIVIHAGADDHVSQPSGAAGARIACGVVR